VVNQLEITMQKCLPWNLKAAVLDLHAVALYDGQKHEVVEVGNDGAMLRDPDDETHVFLAHPNDIDLTEVGYEMLSSLRV